MSACMGLVSNEKQDDFEFQIETVPPKKVLNTKIITIA